MSLTKLCQQEFKINWITTGQTYYLFDVVEPVYVGLQSTGGFASSWTVLNKLTYMLVCHFAKFIGGEDL